MRFEAVASAALVGGVSSRLHSLHVLAEMTPARSDHSPATARRDDPDRFRAMVEQAHGGIWEVDDSGHTTFVNRRIGEMLGWSPKEMLGRHFREFMHPDDRERALVRFAGHLQGESGAVERRFITRHGEVLWASLSTFPRRGPEGDIDSVVGMVSDITALKEAQEELRRSRATYRAVVENSPDSVARFDLDLRHLFVNRRLEELAGIPREDFLGKTSAELGFDPELVAVWNDEMNEVIRTGVPATISFDFVSPDGTPGHFEARVIPEFDAEGRVSTLLSTVRDVTERRSAEEGIRKLTASVPGAVYQFLLRPDGSVSVPILGGKDRDLLEISTGGPDEDGASVFDLVHPDDLGTVQSTIARSALELSPWHQIFRLNHPERGTVWVEGEALPERVADGGTLWHGYVRDITERRREQRRREHLEAQVRKRQKLESLGVLAGGVAHDFNNTLMTVMGHAELTLDDLSRTESEDATLRAIRESAGESLRSISAAARKAAELCREMLNYAGEGSLSFRETDVRTVILDTSELMEASILRSAKLDLNLPETLPPIEADPDQLGQIMMNLLLNASEAIGEREGEIRIAVDEVFCDAEALRNTEVDDRLEEGPYVRVSISDNGEGMDEETRSRIFEPFFTTRFTGRGLGLASTIGILRSHRGGLSVRSRPGEGTTFELLFPVRAEQVAAE